jgi:hypothetical protein
VPADYNAWEPDSHGEAVARSDGGTNRTGWEAKAFAYLPRVVRD